MSIPFPESQFEPPNLAPHSQEAEESVLGSVLINPDAFIEVAEFLRAGHFFIARNGWIWEAMCRLYKRGEIIDYLTVIEELRSQNRLEDIGGAAYITYLTSNVGTSIYAETYGRIVERAAIRRRMLAASTEIARLARDEESDIGEVVAQASQAWEKVAMQTVSNDWKFAGDVASAYFDRVVNLMNGDEKLTGIKTGLELIDRALRGLRTGRFYVLGARPGMGKSWFVFQLALAAARQGYRVGIISMEMPAEDIINRFYALMTGINASKIDEADLTADEFRRLTAALNEYQGLNIFIDDSGKQTAASIRRKSKRLKMRHGIDLLIVDYLQLAGSETSQKEYDIVTEVSKELSALAKPDALNIPVLAVAQLNRDLESRADKRPMMADLRSSGQIEQDASVIMFLYRDWVYHQTAYDVGGKVIIPGENEAEIIVAKNRQNGGRHAYGNFKLFYDFENPRFGNLHVEQVHLGDFEL